MSILSATLSLFSLMFLMSIATRSGTQLARASQTVTDPLRNAVESQVANQANRLTGIMQQGTATQTSVAQGAPYQGAAPQGPTQQVNAPQGLAPQAGPYQPR